MVSLNTDSSHPVYRALDYKEAEQLLSVITLVLCNRKPKMKWKNTILPAAALLVTCFAVWRFAPAPLTGHATVRTGRTPECHRRIGSPRFQGLPQLRNPAPRNPYFGHNTTRNADDGQTMPAETQPGLLQPGRLPWPARKR
jgi:TrbB protein